MGERLTLTYCTRGDVPLRVDIYPFTPATSTTSKSSSFPPPSPFILYLHSSPRNPFFAGSRRLVPPWLLAVCKQKGWPLLSADYRLAPEATLADSWEDVRSLWSFIADQGGMNWCITSAGGGSEADSGAVSLADGFQALQQRGGVDATKGCVVAAGGAAYLGALGGALLRPAPVSLVLTHPILDPASTWYTTPSPPLPATPGSKRRTKRLEAVLARAGQADKAIVAASDLETYEDQQDSSKSSSSNSNTIFGWDPSRWRSRMTSRSKERPGQIHGKERSSLYAAVRRSGQLPQILQPPYRLADVVAGKCGVASNTPYPPLLLLSAGDDEYIDPLGAAQFLNSLRAADPAAAALDRLLERSLAHTQRGGSPRDTVPIATANANSTAKHGEELFDPTRRFLQRVVLDRRARHGFDMLVWRNDERFAGEFDAIEGFLANWIHMASLDAKGRGSGEGSTSKGAGRVAKL